MPLLHTRGNKPKIDKGQFNKTFNSHRINHRATKMFSGLEALTEAVAVNNVTNLKTDTKAEVDPNPDQEMTKTQTQQTSKPCYRCGKTNHDQHDCWFKDKNCMNCDK